MKSSCMSLLQLSKTCKDCSVQKKKTYKEGMINDLTESITLYMITAVMILTIVCIAIAHLLH